MSTSGAHEIKKQEALVSFSIISYKTGLRVISSSLAQGCFSLNTQNRKDDASIFFLRSTKILTNMQKNFFEILVLTALSVGLIWTILELTPKSALLPLTILYIALTIHF